MGGSRSRPWPVSLYQQTRESCQRMGRLVLWLALAVLLPAPAILQPLDQAVLEEQEQMKELLTSMFIDNHREGRDLEEDMDEEEMGEARDMDDENEDESNLVDDEADTEEGVEVVSSKDPQEIARFNNYMDAIYRRMNAALRAKLMDPMVLNMNAKVAKKDKKDKKDKKKRVERSADLEEDEEEDEVDRMGEVEEPEEDKEAKKMARKEKKKKRKNKKNKKDKKEKKERKKPLSPEKLKKKEERERKRMEKKAARKASKNSRVERSA